MSFVFRGSRNDLESGFPNYVPERRTMRFHGNGRSITANPMAFLVTVLLLLMILNTHQMSPNFLLWLGLGVFLMATSLRMYAMCQQLQAQAQAQAHGAGGFVGHTELRLRIPPSIAFTTRGRLQGLRLQLALLDRDFDDLDYDALRALDADNPPGIAFLSETEINALPIHKYKSLTQQAASSSQPGENNYPLEQLPSAGSTEPNTRKTDAVSSDSGVKGREEELTCSVCLEQVVEGELVRSLPCLHQFHSDCIDQWLRQQATCPVCKFRLGSDWQDNLNSATTAYVV